MSSDEDRRVLAQRARRLAQPVGRIAPSTSLTVIDRGGERFALRTADIAAVLRAPQVVSLPGLPPVVSGLLSYRGDPLPVFDVRALLGGSTGGGIAAAVVLAGEPHAPLALAADRVDEVSIAEGDLGPTRLDGPLSSISHGTTSAGLVVLEVDRVLTDPRFVVSEGTAPS